MYDSPDVIGDDETVSRALRHDWIVSGPEGGARVSSAAFKDRHEGKVSVYRDRLITHEEIVIRHPDHSVCSLGVRVIRDADLIIEPDTKDQHEAHASIFSTRPNGRLTESESRRLARAAAITLCCLEHRGDCGCKDEKRPTRL